MILSARAINKQQSPAKQSGKTVDGGDARQKSDVQGGSVQTLCVTCEREGWGWQCAKMEGVSALAAIATAKLDAANNHGTARAVLVRVDR